MYLKQKQSSWTVKMNTALSMNYTLINHNGKWFVYYNINNITQ